MRDNEVIVVFDQEFKPIRVFATKAEAGAYRAQNPDTLLVRHIPTEDLYRLQVMTDGMMNSMDLYQHEMGVKDAEIQELRTQLSASQTEAKAMKELAKSLAQVTHMARNGFQACENAARSSLNIDCLNEAKLRGRMLAEHLHDVLPDESILE
jgi:hypothetical protein